MKLRVYRRVVKIHPMRLEEGPRVYGHVIPIEMECGHVDLGNPTFDYRSELGRDRRCHWCEEQS